MGKPVDVVQGAVDFLRLKMLELAPKHLGDCETAAADLRGRRVKFCVPTRAGRAHLRKEMPVSPADRRDRSRHSDRLTMRRRGASCSSRWWRRSATVSPRPGACGWRQRFRSYARPRSTR